MKGDQYVPVFGDFQGNPEQGYEHVRWALGGRCSTLEGAIKLGYIAQSSDDFNVAVVRHDEVVALLWMNEDMGEPADVLAEYQAVI
jgi:hypothetical protein